MGSVLSGRPKPYNAEVSRSDNQVHLGSSATAEEAALCITRSLEGRKAAERAAAAPPPRVPLTRVEANRAGGTVSLGSFATAPRRLRCLWVARSVEGQVAAERAATGQRRHMAIKKS